MTAVYFAMTGSGEVRQTLKALASDMPNNLNVLVSFHYLAAFDAARASAKLPNEAFSGLMLDSGAFSAWSKGATIDIDALTEESKKPRWKESVALDVVGNHEQSLANARRMKAHGSKAFPVFHIGEPWSLLLQYKAEFSKVGLSCRFGEPVSESMRWLEQCFARAWPYRFHSFGWVQDDMLTRFPFHSADAITWTRAGMWGKWAAFPGIKSPTISKHGVRPTRDLRADVFVFLRLQEKLKSLWSKELAKL